MILWVVGHQTSPNGEIKESCFIVLQNLTGELVFGEFCAGATGEEIHNLAPGQYAMFLEARTSVCAVNDSTEDPDRFCPPTADSSAQSPSFELILTPPQP